MAGKPQPKKEYVREGSGRPSKFTPERRAAIIDAISHRIPYEFAAEANGICEDTLYEWIKIGKQHRSEGIDSDYTVFTEAIKRAEMTKIREHSDMIAAKPERWQADAWILERRWHRHYSPNAAIIDINQRLNGIEHGESKNEVSRKEKDGDEA